MTTATMQLARGQKIKVKVQEWIMRDRKMFSSVMEGIVEVVTSRAILFTGHAVVEGSANCLRCGAVISNPASIWCGYGPHCARQLGIPHEGVIEDPAKRAEIAASVARQTQVQAWLPLSAITVLSVQGAGEQPAAIETAPAPAPDATLAVINGKIVVKAKYDHKDKCKSVASARWDSTARAWTYANSATTAEALIEAFDGLEVVQEESFKNLLQQAQIRQEATAHKTAQELPAVPVSNTAAWLHQKQAFWFAKDLQACMFAMGMGTGKSKVAVDLIVNNDHKLSLIIAPKSAVGVWPKQFRTHAGVAVHVQRLDNGSVAKKLELAKDAIATAKTFGKPVVLVINYESAWRDPFGDWALKQAWDCVILDESHKVKAPGGKAAMFCGTLGKRAKQRLCLTGTPMPHSPLDIYSQYRFLDPGVYGTSFSRFRQRYAVMGGYQGYQVTGFQRQDELAEKMYSIAYRATADVLDLPETMHITRTCQLNNKARKIYEQLDNEFYAGVESGEITAANALVKLLRLRQLTSGHLVDDEKHLLEQLDTGKETMLAEVLDDLPTNEPVIVFCTFHAELDAVKRVCEAQGRRYGELSGRCKDGLTNDATMAADKDVVAVQIQSGGAGIDLTRAAYAIYYSVDFSLGNYDQSLARVHRPGQTRPVVFVHLLAENTVDTKVYKALEQRRDVVDFVMENKGQVAEEDEM